MNEIYHSLYTKDDTNNLTLIDAAYRDVAATIKLERSLEMFGKKYKCQSAGPDSMERNSKNHLQQNSRVSKKALYLDFAKNLYWSWNVLIVNCLPIAHKTLILMCWYMDASDSI